MNIEQFAVLIPIVVSLLFLYKILRSSNIKRREKFISDYRFPKTINQKLKQTYPHLTDRQVNQVISGLRDYFHVCNQAGRRMVSMPSQAVDVAWHEFILFTRDYKSFCQKALGRFLHHTPAEAMKSPNQAQSGIQRAWKYACLHENMLPRNAKRLPLLFAMDAKLNIPDGFKYSLDCTKKGSHEYCAGNIGCSSGCGGDTSDFGGDSSSCGGDSSGCGGGCGGD